MFKNLSFFILICFLTQGTLSAQPWKVYPYIPDDISLIQFPIDEGRHPAEEIEWWYTTGHFTGLETGNEYTFMLTYFYYSSFISDGFRILNIANETTGEFFTNTELCNYPTLSQNHLEIGAELQGSMESWITKTDINGDFLPFQYEINAASPDGAIHFDLNTIKRPLIIDGDGYFPQGESNYTYYYSLTGIELTGDFTIGDITEEVEGTAWIDRQYGSFNPATGEKYEWFSLQLSNGMDINLWNIFNGQNDIPNSLNYRVLSSYVNENTSFTISDFNIERLKYDLVQGTDRVYAQKWRLTADSMDIDLIITTQNPENEVLQPFKFFEGSTTIEGTINGQEVTGKGFAELLHTYQHPDISFLAPIQSNPWSIALPIEWDLINPDEGRPLSYDISVKNDNDTEFVNIAENIVDNSFVWDGIGFPLDDSYTFKIYAHSIDSTLNNSIETPISFVLPQEDLAKKLGLTVHPNPTTDYIQIQLKTNKTTPIKSWKLHNSLGQIIRQGIGTFQSKIMINVKNITTGTYNLVIETKDNQSIKKRVVIQ